MNRSSNSPSYGIQVAEDIVPLGEFKARLSEKLRELKEHRRPVVVTQNGKAAAVVLAPEEFDRLTSQARFVRAVHEGLGDFDAGRVMDDDALGRELDARFGALNQPAKKK